jgi:hypothetical protein
MLLLWGIGAGLLSGRLTGGRFGQLADLPLRGAVWLLGVLAVQVAFFTTPLAEMNVVVAIGPAVFLTSIGVLIWQLLRNRRLGRGVDLALVGLCLNFLVIAANGGRMPAREDLLATVRGAEKAQAVTAPTRSAYATPLHEATRLAFLGDQLAVRLPGHHGNVYSIGDVLVSAGLGLVLFQGMRRRPATLADQTHLTPASEPATR